jgi:hypothetical protein
MNCRVTSDKLEKSRASKLFRQCSRAPLPTSFQLDDDDLMTRADETMMVGNSDDHFGASSRNGS